MSVLITVLTPFNPSSGSTEPFLRWRLDHSYGRNAQLLWNPATGGVVRYARLKSTALDPVTGR
ncbi:hypothetical protein [Actinomadura bangladeshensis]|uniref:Uncharacterized protein n=1 Tax=Actinomadura bangladeshensis TaxID=453573 RepID=A0A4R4NJ53_9ACTN|nr:hypothetical protein [Actinomadura bangladeshensis]TDC09388.1 hypothetical protein E1284_29575 [Actinomadura bangladeshensis]